MGYLNTALEMMFKKKIGRVKNRLSPQFMGFIANEKKSPHAFNSNIALVKQKKLLK